MFCVVGRSAMVNLRLDDRSVVVDNSGKENLPLENVENKTD